MFYDISASFLTKNKKSSRSNFFVILSCHSLAALWSPAGKELASWLSYVLCFLVFLSHSHVVSRVGCGTCLYRFLMFALFTSFSTVYCK